MALPQIIYGGGPTTLTFKRGTKGFSASDSARRNDNVSTSGLRESVYEATDLMIGFSLPGLLISDDFTAWENFYSWALQGNSFSFVPNLSVLVASVPWAFNCLVEDKEFSPKYLGGMGRFSLDCKFRVVLDGSAPANAGMIMRAYWGMSPS
ncbi:MAG TPA: hypothetical protein VG273_11760 [Bryobacteraceae bacterium]|jgi:hypothetical protein|nr:hypothetical protein [Bryobacteraceae bacterium]